MDFKYPTLVKLIFALLPFVNTLYRWFYFWRNELMFIVLFARWGIFYVICFFFVIFFSFCLFVFLCSPFFLARWSDLFLFFVFCDFSFFVVFLCSYSQFYLPQLGPFYICQVKALLYEGLCPFNKCFLLVNSYSPRRITHFDS